jgi:hypothetical protein
MRPKPDDRQIMFPFALLRAQAAPAFAAAEPLAPRPSAVRVPEPEARNETPNTVGASRLFVHEAARQALEKRLEAFCGERVSVSITDNRRTMVSHARRSGALALRIHHMFLEADEFTLRAVARYITKSRDRSASAVLGQYIEAHRQRIATPRKATTKLRTAGTHFDLAVLFDDINRRYFQGLVDARITWGKDAGKPTKRRRRSRSIKLGSYCSDQKLIRIHPALDRDFVPRYFVEYVIFHEMLHHVVPMPVREGRRVCHSREFRARERTFELFTEAERWEKQHVARLLR